jgi:hypothetical protein
MLLVAVAGDLHLLMVAVRLQLQGLISRHHLYLRHLMGVLGNVYHNKKITQNLGTGGTIFSV